MSKSKPPSTVVVVAGVVVDVEVVVDVSVVVMMVDPDSRQRHSVQ